MFAKTCYKCKKNKLLEEFSKNSSISDGHCNKCKECTKAYMTRYREKHLEKVKESDKRYRKENPDKILAKQKKFKQKNPNYYKEYGQKWREAHPQYMREYSRNYPRPELTGLGNPLDFTHQ